MNTKWDDFVLHAYNMADIRAHNVQTGVSPFNKTCHPGDHYWDFHHGTILLSQSLEINQDTIPYWTVTTVHYAQRNAFPNQLRLCLNEYEHFNVYVTLHPPV